MSEQPAPAQPRSVESAARQPVPPRDGIVLTPQQQRSRRNRNIAIGLAVAFFVLLFYVVTIAKMTPGALKGAV